MSTSWPQNYYYKDMILQTEQFLGLISDSEDSQIKYVY